jgi:hypothetical protein
MCGTHALVHLGADFLRLPVFGFIMRFNVMEPAGIEPATSALQRRRSAS